MGPLLYGNPGVTRADVRRQGQDGSGEAAQTESENENPAHHPDAAIPRRGATVSTARRPAGLHDDVP